MRTRGRHAFTLLELLVAAGITALVASLGLAVTVHMTEAWSRNSGDYEMQAVARAALDQLSLDLQSALYRDDGAVWLRATVLDNPDYSGLWEIVPRQKPGGSDGDSLRLNEPELAGCRFGQAGVFLSLFTSVRSIGNDADAGGMWAPTAVGYQLIRRHTGANATGMGAKYLLCRAVARPGRLGSRPGALECGFNLDPADGSIGYMSPSPTNDGTQTGDPFSLRHPASSDTILAENVVDFGLRLYRPGPAGGLEQIFPADGNETGHLARKPCRNPDAAACFPAAADVMLRVLSAEGARKVALLEAQPGARAARPPEYRTDAEWWWGVVEANSRVFTRRIVLPAQWP